MVPCQQGQVTVHWVFAAGCWEVLKKVPHLASGTPMPLCSYCFDIVLSFLSAVTLTLFLKTVKRASHLETMFGERWLSHCPWEQTTE